jgi:hypothetical protein
MPNLSDYTGLPANSGLTTPNLTGAKADVIYDTNATNYSGFKFNTTSGRNNLVFQDTVNNSTWEFEEDGGVWTPINRTKVTYYATGADQTFNVPATNSWVFVKVWGAGGGPGRPNGWSYGAMGGGGGHSRGLVPVTPSGALTVKCGIGGATAIYQTNYGGGVGAVNTSDTGYCGQGGGYSGVFIGSTPYLIAGGGGGGGSTRAWSDGNIGGAGGGLVGQKGGSPYDAKQQYGGGGGTQSAGGYNATSGSAPYIGTQYLGGTAGTNSYGGGGGGGWYGGGGGTYSESNSMCGGGGGSGYVNSAVKFGGTYSGSSRFPGYVEDNDLPKTTYNSRSTWIDNYAHGGLNIQNNVGTGTQMGGDGVVVIYY